METAFLAIGRAWDDCAARYSAEDQLPQWAHARLNGVQMRVGAALAALSGHDSASARAILTDARARDVQLLGLDTKLLIPGTHQSAENTLGRIDAHLKGIAEKGDDYVPPRATPSASPAR
jgi:hypothetical protein